jgi:uncharacterized FlgJ-related protein
MQKDATDRLLARLDADEVSDHDAVVFSVPITLPYPIHEAEYQRTDGDFEYQGEYFKLVKQKIENDTLFLVCVKNKEARKIARALTDYSKLANNIPTESNKAALNFLAKLFKDFNPENSLDLSYSTYLERIIIYFDSVPAMQAGIHSLQLPPPEDIA